MRLRSHWVPLSVVALAALAAAPLVVQATRRDPAETGLGPAGALAVERMERLRSSEFDALAAGGSLSENVPGYHDGAPAGYVVRWRVTDDADPASVKTITVRAIALQQVEGQLGETTLSSLKTR